jgi:hypothetical protein
MSSILKEARETLQRARDRSPSANGKRTEPVKSFIDGLSLIDATNTDDKDAIIASLNTIIHLYRKMDILRKPIAPIPLLKIPITFIGGDHLKYATQYHVYVDAYNGLSNPKLPAPNIHQTIITMFGFLYTVKITDPDLSELPENYYARCSTYTSQTLDFLRDKAKKQKITLESLINETEFD